MADLFGAVIQHKELIMQRITIAIMVIVLFAATIGIGYTVSRLSQANVNAVQCEITSTHYSGFSYYGNLRNYVSKPCQ